MRIGTLLLFFLTSLPVSLFAQGSNIEYFAPYKHPHRSEYSVSAGFGYAGYDGTLASFYDFSEENNIFNPHVFLGIKYQVTNYIGVRLDAGYFRLKASSYPSSSAKDYSFTSNNLEFSLSALHYLFPQVEVDERARQFNFYALAGVGGLHFDVKGDNTDQEAVSSKDEKLAVVFPVGLGSEYYLTRFLSLGLEASYRFTTSDMLDRVSFDNIPTASRQNDGYFLLGARFKFQFPTEYNYREYLKRKDLPPDYN